jgi:hypothetical protein
VVVVLLVPQAQLAAHTLHSLLVQALLHFDLFSLFQLQVEVNLVALHHSQGLQQVPGVVVHHPVQIQCHLGLDSAGHLLAHQDPRQLLHSLPCLQYQAVLFLLSK